MPKFKSTVKASLALVLVSFTVSLSLIILGAAISVFNKSHKPLISANDESKNKSPALPFYAYANVADGIYVIDKRIFSSQSSQGNIQSNSNNEGEVVQKRRPGSVLLAPGLPVYIDLVTTPTHEAYQFKSTVDEAVIHEFRYSSASVGSLLLTGQGVVYEYAPPDLVCRGSVTKKYQFKKGGLIEIPQPLLYLNAETNLREDVRLFFSHDASSPQVATLLKGTKVTVVYVQDKNIFLIKTPLGLTGWLVNESLDNIGADC